MLEKGYLKHLQQNYHLEELYAKTIFSFIMDLLERRTALQKVLLSVIFFWILDVSFSVVILSKIILSIILSVYFYFYSSEIYISILFFSLQCRGVVVMTTAQLHSTKPELRFCAGLNLACGESEICDDEDFWQWSQLEIWLNVFL